MKSAQESARHLLARTRQQKQNRRAAMLERSAQEITRLGVNRQEMA
jgi:hypothetical protein